VLSGPRSLSKRQKFGEQLQLWAASIPNMVSSRWFCHEMPCFGLSIFGAVSDAEHLHAVYAEIPAKK
jgi:hypothetical protein